MEKKRRKYLHADMRMVDRGATAPTGIRIQNPCFSVFARAFAVKYLQSNTCDQTFKWACRKFSSSIELQFTFTFSKYFHPRVLKREARAREKEKGG